jgi:hypothetical protein
MDKYLNLKFPDAMMTPQSLMRPIMSEREVEIEMGDDGLLFISFLPRTLFLFKIYRTLADLLRTQVIP